VTGQTPDERRETDWERRRRLAEVFGDVLPETTSDERDDPAEGRTRGEGRGDAWLKEQVPPHHG
jgi:hypothetical protein